MAKIEKINDELFIGEKTIKNNEINFVFEKITKTNRTYWKNYASNAKIINAQFKSICSSEMYDSNQIENCKFLNLSENDYYNIKKRMVEKKWTRGENPFFGVDGGITGMVSMLRQNSDEDDENGQVVYVAYISKNRSPSVKKMDEYIHIDNYQHYCDIFGDIVMSFMFITHKNSPITTHYGIFREPSMFLDTTGKYSDISLVLHGFVSCISLQYFDNKKYMINEPMPSMFNIIKSKIDKKYISIGTNKDFTGIYSDDEGNIVKKNNEKFCMLSKDYPPRLYESGYRKFIVKKNVNLYDYIDSPVPEEFIEQEVKMFDYGGATAGSYLTMIDLVAFSTFYDCKI